LENTVLTVTTLHTFTTVTLVGNSACHLCLIWSWCLRDSNEPLDIYPTSLEYVAFNVLVFVITLITFGEYLDITIIKDKRYLSHIPCRAWQHEILDLPVI